MPRQSFLQRKLTARRLWKEFAPLAKEVLTATDAENVGHSAAWFQQVLAEKAGSGDSVSVGRLRFAMELPEVVDLIRYKAEVLALQRSLAEVADATFSPYDAVAAAVVDRSFLDVCRMLFPEHDGICLGDLVPHIRRPVVREFFGPAGPAAMRSRLESIQLAAAARTSRMEEASFALDREVNLANAEMSGATGPGTGALAELWFGKDATLNVETLLQVPQVEAFARLAKWRIMMAAA